MIELNFPVQTTSRASFQPACPEVEGKPIKLTQIMLQEIGAVKIFESDTMTEVWQIGLLQYGQRRDNLKFQLWNENLCDFVDEAQAITYLHELQMQYFGLTFKNLNICQK